MGRPKSTSPKVCPTCQRLLPRDAFDPIMRDGYQNGVQARCRECQTITADRRAELRIVEAHDAALLRSGICACGCNQPTKIATRTHRGHGMIVGLPMRYLEGHSRRNSRVTPPNPSGLCQCGCGQKTSIASATDETTGAVAGYPVRYIRGHYGKSIATRDRTPRLCACGCGQMASPYRRYVRNHHGRKHTNTYRIEDRGYIGGPCRIWQGRLDKEGYGRMGAKLAHRVAYEEVKGPIPKGWPLDHLCFQHDCVHPDHLEAVTHAINIQRKVEGKTRKLTWEIVREIRRLFPAVTQEELAQRFDVTQGNISAVIRGRTWKEGGDRVSHHQYQPRFDWTVNSSAPSHG